MTEISHVRVLSPLTNQSTQFGETLKTAKEQTANLEATLRELDKLTENLAGEGMTIVWTLGPVGDAAAAARRDMDKEPTATFALPKPA